MAVILPGATVGILGGGQLGRMTAMAARELGYHVHALDPDPRCAARPVVDRCVTAGFDDVTAAVALAQQCQVVTLEIEKISVASLEAAREYVPVRPGAEVLAVVQNKARQKQWLVQNGFPVGPFRVVHDESELAAAVANLGGAVFVKACTGGYDGRGQVEIREKGEILAAWETLGRRPAVVEQALDLETEVSVLVARRPSGQTAVYPPALNHHERRILAWSVLPGPLPERLTRQAMDLARAIASTLDVEGLLVVEMFVLRDGSLLVNELAPRPHNSFHATAVGCVTSQFEQLVRAVCDLPLGSTEVLRPTAIMNLLGDLWLGPTPPALDAALAIPGVRLHLYGKAEARPGRKMGHLSAVGNTPEEAVARVQRAYTQLSRDQRTATSKQCEA